MSDVVTGLIVTRWKRYGKDRLYVSGADGAKVGWWDLVTDEAHPESPQHASALETAVAGWRAAGSLPTRLTRSAPPSRPSLLRRHPGSSRSPCPQRPPSRHRSRS